MTKNSHSGKATEQIVFEELTNAIKKKKKSLLSWTFCLGGGKRRKYTVSVKLTVTFRAAALNTDPNCIDALETVEALGLDFGVMCFAYLLVFL